MIVQRFGHKPLDWATVKLALVAVYLLLDHAAFVDRIASLGLSANLAVWLGLYCSLAAALVAAALIRSNAARIICGAVLAVGSIALQSFEWATGSALSYGAFEMLVASYGDAHDALSQHGAILIKAVGAALVLFAAIALPPGRLALPFGSSLTIPAAVILALAGLLYVRGGEGARALPPPFTPLAETLIMVGLRLTAADRPRQAVMIAPGKPLVSGDIVLIIDESVAANYLDINHRRRGPLWAEGGPLRRIARQLRGRSFGGGVQCGQQSNPSLWRDTR